MKTHPIKREPSLTPPKIHIDQTLPFRKRLRRCCHPLTTSNNPSPSGYCLHFNVLLLMAAVIGPKTGSRVLTVGCKFPMMGERIGTGNPAGCRVNAVTWNWIDGAPLHHLRRESTTYAGVLLETDVSMKWRRQKKRA